MEPVDLALCLAVDVSASVNFDEFGLMIGGLAAAFRHPEIATTLPSGPRGAIAATVLFWSGAGTPPEVGVPWTRLADPAASAAFAEAIEAAPRLPAAGGTALGEGMAAGLALLARCPAPATRLVLDMSGDGASNQGRPPAPFRDAAVSAGVTINALAVVNEEADLLTHFLREVIGGPGSFAMDCRDYADFAEAIRRKLLRELGGTLLAHRGLATAGRS